MHNIELGCGTLYLQSDNELVTLMDCVPILEESELSAAEQPPKTFSYKQSSASFEVSYDLNYDDLKLLAGPYEMPDKFRLEADVPIIIQARWHKKRRISKKWLKRYGMKPDVIKMQTDATMGEYNPDNGEFSFETDKIEYIFKPHQKRKGIKIEW